MRAEAEGAKLSQDPYWWEAAPRRNEAVTDLPGQCDVGVVGAGFTGASAALTLSRAGRDVVVLDAEGLGAGASSRNGGMIGSGHRVSLADLEGRYGRETAIAMLREGQAALAYTTGLIESEGIDCGFVRCGRFRAAWTPEHYEAMARDLEAQRKLLGIDVHLVPRSEQALEVVTERYHGGCIFPQHGGLHPGLLHQGLVERAEAAGARFAGKTPVRRILGERGDFRLETDRGVIRARDVIVATNGYSGTLLPWLRRRIVPMFSYIVASESLPPERLRALIPGGRMIVETRARHCYYRLSPDGTRLIFGGRMALQAITAERAASVALRLILDLFPSLAGLRLTHSWSGRVGMTREQLPHLGLYRGLHYAAGYSGSGVAMAPYLGHKIALRLLGKPEGATAFDPGGFPALPFVGGRTWILPLLDLYYQAKTRREGSP